MIESADAYIERIALAARQPVAVDPGAKARLFAAIRAEPMLTRRSSAWSWLVDRRVMLSPLGTLAVAAGLVGFGVGLGVFTEMNRDGQQTGRREAVAAAQGQLPVSDTLVREVFVLVAPQAKHVTVVGDFNQWNPTATPLVRSDKDGPWTVTLPLDAGRHVYSFMVDGQWTSDPSAPLAPDGFGRTNSVLMVTGGSAL